MPDFNGQLYFFRHFRISGFPRRKATSGVNGATPVNNLGDARENMYHNKVGGNVPSWFDKLTTNGTEGSYKP